MRTTFLCSLLLLGLALSGCDSQPSATPIVAPPPVEGAPAAGDTAGSSAAPDATPAGMTITPENTKITFTGFKADGQHEGGFKQFSGKVETSDGQAATLKFTVEIQTDSLYSDDDRLTGHLKTPDFFDVRNIPTASFTTTAVKSAEGDGSYTVEGNLTLHGVTQPISFPARITMDDARITLSANFNISRKQFGMTYGQERVNDEVAIQVALDVSRS
jgi:polyisoprenoid-binding protein YceI